MGHTDTDVEVVRTRLARIREDLLGGRGPGASTDEVLATTRNRVEVAGMTATRRLELTARQTALARGDTDAVTTAAQLRRAEVACGFAAAGGRLSPGATPRGPGTSPEAVGKASAAMGLVGVLVVWALRRGSAK